MRGDFFSMDTILRKRNVRRVVKLRPIERYSLGHIGASSCVNHNLCRIRFLLRVGACYARVAAAQSAHVAGARAPG